VPAVEDAAKLTEVFGGVAPSEAPVSVVLGSYPMSPWLAGLVGVVLGGVLTGAFQLIFAIREERRQVRVGARLMLHELDFFRTNITRAVAGEVSLNDRWLRPRYDELSAIWAKYRDVTGGVLSYGDWQAVSLALQNCERLFQGAPDQVPAGTLGGVRNTLALAIEVLEPRAEGFRLRRAHDSVSYAEPLEEGPQKGPELPDSAGTEFN